MSKLSEEIMNMTEREIETAEWKIVYATLILVKQRFREEGLGNQSWLDGVIGMAEVRSKFPQDRHNTRLYKD